MCVYLFIYLLFICSFISRERMKQFAPNLACLFLETRKRTWEGQTCRKSVLSLIPSEGGSCSSETKHDRRTAPRPKLFVSRRILQKQRLQPRKTLLSSIPVKDGFWSSDTKLNTRTAPRQMFLLRRLNYRNRGHNPRKLSLVRLPEKIVSVARKLNTIEERRQDQI
jgi:hypothetical protein